MKLLDINYELLESLKTEYMIFKKFKHFKKKTFEIDVITKDETTVLGLIKWHCGWRRYIFEPESYTIYDSNCLKTISNYIDKLMEDRK